MTATERFDRSRFDRSRLDWPRLDRPAWGRRRFVLWGASAAAASLLLKGCGGEDASSRPHSRLDPAASPSGKPIRVGTVFSLTGALARRESPMNDAVELAVTAINLRGGLLGRPVQVKARDPKSDDRGYLTQAVNLLELDDIPVMFGGGSTEARESMAAALATRKGLLWYPLAYAGNECASTVLYVGPVPNQTIEPAVQWVIETLLPATAPKTAQEKSLFLLADDDAYGRTALEITTAKLKTLNAKLAGQALLDPASPKFDGAIANLRTALPQGGAVLAVVSASERSALFKALRAAKLPPDSYPVLAIDPMEGDVGLTADEAIEGYALGGNYLSGVSDPLNQDFVELYRAQFGADRLPTPAAAAAYSAVLLWKAAVEKVGSPDDPETLRAATYGLSLDAPQGSIRLESNHHLAQPFYIARLSVDNDQPKLTLATPQPPAIQPQPWNPLTEAGRGFACDWSDANKGGKYKTTPPVRVEDPDPPESKSSRPAETQSL